MARLILNWEGVDLVTHELIDDTVMVGRAPSNNIIIEHLTVSAEHAVLLRVADSYFLKDLNSTNGTQLNGVLVTEADLNISEKRNEKGDVYALKIRNLNLIVDARVHGNLSFLSGFFHLQAPG